MGFTTRFCQEETMAAVTRKSGVDIADFLKKSRMSPASKAAFKRAVELCRADAAQEMARLESELNAAHAAAIAELGSARKADAVRLQAKIDGLEAERNSLEDLRARQQEQIAHQNIGLAEGRTRRFALIEKLTEGATVRFDDGVPLESANRILAAYASDEAGHEQFVFGVRTTGNMFDISYTVDMLVGLSAYSLGRAVSAFYDGSSEEIEVDGKCGPISKDGKAKLDNAAPMKFRIRFVAGKGVAPTVLHGTVNLDGLEVGALGKIYAAYKAKATAAERLKQAQPANADSAPHSES